MKLFFPPLRHAIFFLPCIVFGSCPSLGVAQVTYGPPQQQASPYPPSGAPSQYVSPRVGRSFPPPPSAIGRPQRPRRPYRPYPSGQPPISGNYLPPPYYPPPYYNNGGGIPYTSSPGNAYPSAPPSRSCVDGVCTGG